MSIIGNVIAIGGFAAFFLLGAYGIGCDIVRWFHRRDQVDTFLASDRAEQSDPLEDLWTFPAKKPGGAANTPGIDHRR